MSKKIIISVVIILLAAILLIPVPIHLKDGGTVKYQAVLYTVSDVHRLTADGGYEDGTIIEVLGVELFNSVKAVPLSDEVQAEPEPVFESTMIPMVKVDGVVYLDTGIRSSEETSRCDGSITSRVSNDKRPTEDDQSNFGLDYSYRYGEAEGTIEVCVEDSWLVFATEEKRQELQLGGDSDTSDYGYDTTGNTAPAFREAPRLTVASDNNTIKALTGTLSWTYTDKDGTAVSVAGDSAHPLMCREIMPCLTIPEPDRSGVCSLDVCLRFGKAPNEFPPSNLTARCWPADSWGDTDARGEAVTVTREDKNIFLVLKDGDYIYEVIAEWDSSKSAEGSVRYSFSALRSDTASDQSID